MHVFNNYILANPPVDVESKEIRCEAGVNDKEKLNMH